ncbi:hypothetical protein SAMN05446635_3879 [Burkholderia sp. OK233]|nr:hypothetical protein SAMN05446635_3879 [Burkholderia sp. OK233]
MLRQGDATKRAQEGNKKGGAKLFLLQIFRLRESYLLALPLSKQGPISRALGGMRRAESPRMHAADMDKEPTG